MPSFFPSLASKRVQVNEGKKRNTCFCFAPSIRKDRAKRVFGFHVWRGIFSERAKENKSYPSSFTHEFW
jgi:hypothetical protein